MTNNRKHYSNQTQKNFTYSFLPVIPTGSFAGRRFTAPLTPSRSYGAGCLVVSVGMVLTGQRRKQSFSPFQQCEFSPTLIPTWCSPMPSRVGLKKQGAGSQSPTFSGVISSGLRETNHIHSLGPLNLLAKNRFNKIQIAII